MKKLVLLKAKDSEFFLIFEYLSRILLNSGRKTIKLASGKFINMDNIKNRIKDFEKE